MPLLKCPSQDALLEYFSIPQELSVFKRLSTKLHLTSCESCRTSVEKIQSTWKAYFQPAPDITSSLLRVYSKLQGDETLVLKGWKLGELTRNRSVSSVLFQEGWLFRGTVSFGLLGLLAVLLVTQLKPSTPEIPHTNNVAAAEKAPLAQIRVEDKNTLKVHYLQPELLQTIEFETTRGSR